MNTALRPFFAGKDVFLTGHTGFKGGWLSLWLADCGARVHGYSLEAPTAPSLFEEARVREQLASHTIGDVRDPQALAAAMQKARPQIVFHLAAQPLVRESYARPHDTFAVNVMGTINVMEAVRACPGVRVCQIITTDKCYENREWVYPYRENDPMGGHDPYSASKGCAELAVASYRKSFFQMPTNGQAVSLATARAGNVIGGGDWAADRIIPDCIRAVENQQPIAVRNPHAIRPWQHVLEPLSGYLTLAYHQWQNPAGFSDAFNFGPLPGGAISVREVVEEVLIAWGKGSWSDLSHNAKWDVLHEAAFLKLDITKAASLLGWMPRWTVQEAIQRTVAWYRQRRAEQSDLRKLCLEQIAAYEKVSE